MASDSDDEDLRRAIAISLQGEQGLNAKQAIVLDEDEPLQKSSNECSSKGIGLLGLDRKRMEQERLNRKRKASEITSADPLQALDRNSEPLRRHKSDGDPTFLEGVVRKTSAVRHPKNADVITLEDVFEKDDLQVAVLSSFQWDIPWLFAKIKVSKTLITLVMQAEDDVTKEQYRRETSYLPNLRLCFPNMEGQINCMHSKLMLLSHPKYLRIVIPTANLVSYDWGETGTMENMCFIIDLPRLPERHRPETLTPFGEEMLYFLRAQGLEKSIVDSLKSFDFSATKELAFIHTIGGAHTGIDEPWRRTGYCGLGRAVQTLGLATQEKTNVDYVTSSVGSLNSTFLSSIYQACKGDDGKAAYERRNGGKSREAQAAKAALADIDYTIEKHFRVYFPTHDTVRNSTARSAGTICFQSKWYNSPTFPKGVMRDCKSVRDGLLMHNKLILVRSSQPWVYIGSANCSESAWGKLSKDRTTKQPKLNCRNWECGVLIPARKGRLDTGERDGKAADGASASLDDTFRGFVPVPMVHPGAEYGARQPWFFMEA